MLSFEDLLALDFFLSLDEVFEAEDFFLSLDDLLTLDFFLSLDDDLLEALSFFLSLDEDFLPYFDDLELLLFELEADDFFDLL